MTDKYKVLLFDLDNTLFDFEHAENSALYKTAERFGQIDDYSNFERTYHAVNKPLWLALERGEITSDFIKTERFIQLVEQLDLAIDPLEMSRYYTEKLGEGIEKMPYAEELCAHLSEKYKLVVVTNGIQTVQENRLYLSGLHRYFEAVVISEKVGVSKPDGRIFHEALAQVNHPDKSSVLMIGDSLKADIKGAVDAGIDACWVNLKNHPEPEIQSYKFVVHHLVELQEILK
ncbi:YjjG family noncanonical pyrimidine nucleotidase [Fusibacter bizertensis]